LTQPTLLVDTSFLGDVLCAEPLVRAVAAQHAGPVDFLAAPGGAALLANHPDLRQVLVYDKRGADRGLGGLRRMAAALRARGYGRAICSHRSWRTAVLLRLARIPERVGFDNASAAWLYSRREPYRKDRHEIERNLALAGGGAWERPRVHPGPQERARAASLAPEPPFVALAPGSIWPTKRWPAQRWAELTAALAESGVAVVLIGGPEDRELAAEIRRLAGEPERVVDLCGATSLRESYAVLELAAALVSNDSAPMHLGVAAGIPVLAVYCSTVPEFGFAPRGKADRVFQVDGLACRPCGVHGRQTCPEKHFRCGLDTAAEAVLGALRPLLATPV